MFKHCIHRKLFFECVNATLQSLFKLEEAGGSSLEEELAACSTI